MENTSLRDPIRSDTFIGPSAGRSGRMLGPTHPEMQDENSSGDESAGWIEEESYVLVFSACVLRDQEITSCPGRFAANDIVPFDNRGHSHACIAIYHAALHANNFAQGSYEYFCAMSNFSWQSQRDIQLRASL